MKMDIEILININDPDPLISLEIYIDQIRFNQRV